MATMDSDYANLTSADPDWLTPTEALTRFRRPEAPVGDVGAATSAPPEQSMFGFRVGNLGFLVAAGTYCEVIGQIPVNPIPNTQPWFSGLLNLRGNLVPAFDLRRLLGEEAADDKKRFLFAIDRGEKTVALWIDGLPEVLSALPQPLGQLPPLPPVLRACVAGGHLHRGHLWLNVRFEELFKTLGRQIAAGQG
jgi:twitching motility protein PilI